MRTTPAGGLKRKVLIVDDHPLLREGLSKAINQQEDLIVCGEADNAPRGLAAIGRLRPDVVIVDISLEEGSGLDLIKDISKKHPMLPVLVLSMHHENLYAERAIKAGARGYVMKNQPVNALLAGLRKLLEGKIAVGESIISRLIVAQGRSNAPKGNGPADILSDRELEVFRLFGEGKSTRQIAGKLHLAISTIESYRDAIKKKLHLANGSELIASAAKFVAKNSNS